MAPFGRDCEPLAPFDSLSEPDGDTAVEAALVLLFGSRFVFVFVFVFMFVLVLGAVLRSR